MNIIQICEILQINLQKYYNLLKKYFKNKWEHTWEYNIKEENIYASLMTKEYASSALKIKEEERRIRTNALNIQKITKTMQKMDKQIFILILKNQIKKLKKY